MRLATQNDSSPRTFRANCTRCLAAIYEGEPIVTDCGNNGWGFKERPYHAACFEAQRDADQRWQEQLGKVMAEATGHESCDDPNHRCHECWEKYRSVKGDEDYDAREDK